MEYLSITSKPTPASPEILFPSFLFFLPSEQSMAMGRRGVLRRERPLEVNLLEHRKKKKAKTKRLQTPLLLIGLYFPNKQPAIHARLASWKHSAVAINIMRKKPIKSARHEYPWTFYEFWTSGKKQGSKEAKRHIRAQLVEIALQSHLLDSPDSDPPTVRGDHS